MASAQPALSFEQPRGYEYPTRVAFWREVPILEWPDGLVMETASDLQRHLDLVWHARESVKLHVRLRDRMPETMGMAVLLDPKTFSMLLEWFATEEG